MPLFDGFGGLSIFMTPAIKDAILRASAESQYWLSYYRAPLPSHSEN